MSGDSSTANHDKSELPPVSFEISKGKLHAEERSRTPQKSASDPESWLPDLPLIITHAVIILVCAITLILGKNGTVHVSEEWPLFTPRVVSFFVGIIVQLALIAPLEFAKRISQIWFWQELTNTGMNYRRMVTTWSVIYSNSYRGAEDLIHGIGPISAFLMLVYVIEVIVCGAIGSLHRTEDVTTLKASGQMALLYPSQDNATTFNSAKQAIDLASRAFLNFAKAYDPLALDGIIFGDGKCKNGTVPPNFVSSCTTVYVSPLAPISLTLKPPPPALPWTTLAPGDTVVTRSTQLDATVECGPSDDIKVVVFDQSDYLWLNVTMNGTRYETHSYLRLWAAQFSVMVTPQVQTVMFGTGQEYSDPVVDDSGALVFAMLAFNLDSYHDMTTITIPYADVNGSRTAGVALCRTRLALGTVAATYEVSQVEPATVVHLRNVVPEVTPTPYLMRHDTAYGVSAALFIFQALYSVTCDILPCVPTGYEPPLINLFTGLLLELPTPEGAPPKYFCDLATVTNAISQLTSRFMVSFAAEPVWPAHLPPQFAATTGAKVYERAYVQQFYTTMACNAVLAVGAASAGGVMIILAVSGRARRMGRSTESLYLLLQALPSNTLPNIPDTDWRTARLGRLKAAAREVHVKGSNSNGKVILSLSTRKREKVWPGKALPAKGSSSKGKRSHHHPTGSAVSTRTSHFSSDDEV
ncbi:hypothetical protein HDU86_001582 [Geranomyces michiganensis]|nr:hypothetical protein HDU86_001582 [Geranomyces michiganensis]